MSTTADDDAGSSSSNSRFEGIEKVKAPNLSAFLTYKPTNILSGTLSGVGNSLGAAVAAIGKVLLLIIEIINYNF